MTGSNHCSSGSDSDSASDIYLSNFSVDSTSSTWAYDERPPFLVTQTQGCFVDEGGAQLKDDWFYNACFAYFVWCHGLNPSEDNRTKILEHISERTFVTARLLFLSSLESNFLPDIIFLLWELHGHDPEHFIDYIRTLRHVQSAPILPRRMDADLGLEGIKTFIAKTIQDMEAEERNDSRFKIGLQVLKDISTDISSLSKKHERFANEYGLSLETDPSYNWKSKIWDEETSQHWILSPYECGLSLFLYSELEIIDKSDRFYLQCSEAQMSTSSSSQMDDPSAPEETDIRLLFGVQGCGKTKAIFDTLSSNWGLYILPGIFGPSRPDRTLQADSVLLWATVYEQMRNDLSRDQKNDFTMARQFTRVFLACRLRELKHFLKRSNLPDEHRTCRHWLQYQLTASGTGDNHFVRYFSIARHLPSSRFNIDMPSYALDGNVLDTYPTWLPRGKFYFCLDEFQSDFEEVARLYSVPTDYEYIPKYDGIMNHIFSEVVNLYTDVKNTPSLHFEYKIFLSGTSSHLPKVHDTLSSKHQLKQDSKLPKLYTVHSHFERIRNFREEFPKFLLEHAGRILLEAWEIFKSTLESDREPSGNEYGGSDRYLSHSNLYVREDDEISRDCFETNAFLSTSGRHLPIQLRTAFLKSFANFENLYQVEARAVALRDFLSTNMGFITASGLPLSGRCLWSSRYAQDVLVTAMSHYAGFQHSQFRKGLPAIAKNIEQDAIKTLISNLKKLRKTDRFVYANICRLVIRADVLNKPTLFPDDYAGEMVTQGFAYAYSDPKSGRWKEGYVRIAEPLAIKAALEYLGTDDEGKAEFERQINEWVYMNQDNASNLGFSTESFLASVMDGMFRTGVELVAETRKTSFLEHLQKSMCFIGKGKFSSRQLPDIQDFELKQPRINDGNMQQSVEFDEWLKQSQEDWAVNPKFCFPSTKAGPDIAFILHRKQNTVRPEIPNQVKRVLVTIQSKTAEQKGLSAFDVEKTIHTIDPNLWYISASDLKPQSKSKVEEWGDTSQCLILSILVSTSNYVKKGAEQVCRDYRTTKKRLERCKQQHPSKKISSREAEQHIQTPPQDSQAEVTEQLQQMDIDQPMSPQQRSQTFLGKRKSSPTEPEDEPSKKAKTLLENLPDVDYAFCVIDRGMTETLFGPTFTKLISMTKKEPAQPQSSELSSHFPLRIVKQTSENDGDRKTKRRKPAECSVCGAVGHYKNNTKCPQYQSR